MPWWLPPLAGGVLIGTASALLMALQGRVAGISGILAAVLPPRPDATSWRLGFLAGLAAGPALAGLAWGGSLIGTPIVSLPLMALAGLLVGVGTGLGSGCTSGHGVCGLARLSPRSLAATATFMAAAAATVYGLRHVL